MSRSISLKEGFYSDYANREMLLDLIRFKSTTAEGLTRLTDTYTARPKELELALEKRIPKLRWKNQRRRAELDF